MTALNSNRYAKSPYALPFGEMMESFRARAGLTRNRLAHLVPCDASFLTRMAAGHRDPPRRQILDGIMDALKLNLPERNRMLCAAGFVPESVERIGKWDDVLQAVSDVLIDPGLSDEEIAEYRETILSVSRRWRRAR